VKRFREARISVADDGCSEIKISHGKKHATIAEGQTETDLFQYNQETCGQLEQMH
jgi:hypothetical protein